MIGSSDQPAQLAAVVAAALAAAGAGAPVAPSGPVGDLGAAGDPAGPNTAAPTGSAWLVASRQMAMSRAMRIYERRIGSHQ